MKNSDFWKNMLNFEIVCFGAKCVIFENYVLFSYVLFSYCFIVRLFSSKTLIVNEFQGPNNHNGYI